MQAALLWTINDFPAYGMMSGWSTKGYMACPTCNKDICSLGLRSMCCLIVYFLYSYYSYNLFIIHLGIYYLLYYLFTYFIIYLRIHYLLFTIHYSLYTIHYSLFTIYYSILTIYY